MFVPQKTTGGQSLHTSLGYPSNLFFDITPSVYCPERSADDWEVLHPTSYTSAPVTKTNHAPGVCLRSRDRIVGGI